MHLGIRTALLACLVVLLVGTGWPAGAAGPTPTTLSVTAQRVPDGEASTVTVRLAGPGDQPVAGAQVRLARREGAGTVPLATLVTDAEGVATAAVAASREPGDNRLVAQYDGDPPTYAASTGSGRIELDPRSSTLRLSAPATVVDERRVTLEVGWRAGNDEPVAGPVRIYRKVGERRWQRFATVRTDAQGRAALAVRPRQDTRWQARAGGLPWVRGDRSGVQRIDNLPAGRPVRFPKGAPRPRISLPDQRHARGAGANLRVQAIPDRVWRQMTGVSWHRGCPVGRGGLRLVQVNYWDYQGYRRRGELVAATAAARPMGEALAEMYRRYLPVRAMYRVDRFGWGRRSHGGNDYASMAAGNTSAFNCRDVTGRPGHRSPHSWGRSLDVNTWENPYRSARGVVPNRWWQSRSHPRVAWRSGSHPVVELMARHGLRWTYGRGDTQHFDYVGGYGRALIGPEPCDRFCD